jgi:glycosyltransferase involved in cell wall biosynthesis
VRVLQLSSDWKWTGPAEPMLRLADGLLERGCRVALACPPAPPEATGSLAEEAERAGFPPLLRLERARGVRPLAGRDVARLRDLVAREPVDVIHTWHTRDHVLALRARGRGAGPAIVRSWRVAGPIPPTPWNRWLFGSRTHGLLCVSPETACRNAPLRRGLPIRGVFGAVDLARFHPEPPDPGVRAGLGLAASDRVVGIVARVQAHRRFDLLLEAARRLFLVDPRSKLLVVGRGTRRAELAEEPSRRLGIADRVVFAGYRKADYAQVLRAIDVFTFLVPGSDGTCRALLEAAACGIPAVVSRRGALPEIVRHGETGLVVDEDPDALCGAWAALLADEPRRLALGRAARVRAEAVFTPARLADEVLALYAEARAATSPSPPCSSISSR